MTSDPQVAPEPPRPRWARLGAVAFAALALLAAGLAAHVDGRLPAEVPAAAPAYSTAPLTEALAHVDSRGRIDIAALKRDRAALDRYVASLAGTSPRNRPERFPTAEDALAYWLNAYHALVLQQVVDLAPRSSPDDVPLSGFWWGRSWPVGGERLTLWSIERRALREAGDARVWLARFTGAAGGPLLDGAPFAAQTLDEQLNGAARRFMARKENVAISGRVVTLSPVFEEHQAAFLAALPEGRSGVLQLVWAFLPESCDGVRPGCDTRADLDRACGPALDACAVQYGRAARAMPARAP